MGSVMVCELVPMSLGLFLPFSGPFCCPVEEVNNRYLYFICVLRISKLQGTSGFSHLEGRGMGIITFFQLSFREGVVTLVFNDLSNFRRFLCKTGKGVITLTVLYPPKPLWMLKMIQGQGKELISKTAVA